jgi:tetratricopeptide (TPR) repeat protein
MLRLLSRLSLLLPFLVAVPALATDVTNREIARLYADAAIAEKDYAGAIRTLSEHVAADPEDGGAWHLLGVTQLLANQPERAIESFEKALPRVPEENRGITRYYLADAYSRKGDPSKSVELLRAAKEEEVSAWSASRALADGLGTGAPLPEIVPGYPGGFDGSLWAGTAYDSNVLLASNDSLATISRSDVASPKFTVGGNAVYTKKGYRGGNLVALGGANFDAHTATNAQRLNSLGTNVGAEWARPASTSDGIVHSFGDDFGLNFLNNDGFSFYSWQDTLRWRGILQQGYGVETEFSAPVRYQKYASPAAQSPDDERTGVAVGAEVAQRRQYRDRTGSIGLAAERAFTRGKNYRSWTFNLPIGWRDPSLPFWGLGLRANLVPSIVRYPSSTNSRHDFNVTGTLSLTKPVRERTTAALNYIYVTNPSNLTAATYQKHTIGLQVIYAIQ